MKKIEFEKKLIHFDDVTYSRQVTDFKANLLVLNKIAEQYEEIFTGKITQERIHEVFDGNYESLRKAAIQAAIKSTKSQVLAEVVLQRIEEKLVEFEFTVSRLVDRFNQSGQRQMFATVTPLSWYSIDSSGRFYIPSETLDKIRENCTNFLESAEEEELYNRMKCLADMINQVFDSLGESVRGNFGNNFLPRHYNLCELLSTDESGRTVPSPEVDYKNLIQ